MIVPMPRIAMSGMSAFATSAKRGSVNVNTVRAIATQRGPRPGSPWVDYAAFGRAAGFFAASVVIARARRAPACAMPRQTASVESAMKSPTAMLC